MIISSDSINGNHDLTVRLRFMRQVAGIQSATHESVEHIKEIGATIDRISEISGAIASAVEEQGAATQEIARNVQKAAKGTTEVSSGIETVSGAANETAAASAQMLAASGHVANKGELFWRGSQAFSGRDSSGLRKASGG